MRVASLRPIATSGEDNSITGKSIQADIDHTEVSRTPIAGATSAGISSEDQRGASVSRDAKPIFPTATLDVMSSCDPGGAARFCGAFTY
jgi:hypothetical protein